MSQSRTKNAGGGTSLRGRSLPYTRSENRAHLRKADTATPPAAQCNDTGACG